MIPPHWSLCRLLSVLFHASSIPLGYCSVVRQVEKAIITAAKHLRAESDENQDPIPQEEIARAIKNVDVDYMVLQLQMWASFRGQTLSRTVRGIMYYSQAVRLLAVVENM